MITRFGDSRKRSTLGAIFADARRWGSLSLLAGDLRRERLASRNSANESQHRIGFAGGSLTTPSAKGIPSSSPTQMHQPPMMMDHPTSHTVPPTLGLPVMADS